MQGKVLADRYKIIKELGKGGMAVVYEARDLLLDRRVAIKMLREEYVSVTDFVKKFHHEAKAVARISHPNVVSIFDIGENDGYHYLVMEDVEGSNLKDIIRNRGHLTVVEALDITSQVCAALTVAHKKNIVHCDIKPHNILINNDNQVKVTDFGIARALTSSTMNMTDTIMGSARYFSPEQARGGEIKTHSDIYSVGVVLYEMLTGEVPFEGESPISVALKHIQEEPQKPSEVNAEISGEVEKIVLKSLAKKPKERFESAREMREAISMVQEKLFASEESNEETEDEDFADGHTKILDKAKLREKEKEIKQTEKKQTERKVKKSKKGFSQKENKLSSGFSSFINIFKKSVPFKWFIYTVIFFGLLFLGMYIFYQSFMDVPVVEVPELVGLEYERARMVAAEEGLGIEKQDEKVFHSDIPENKIISQYPEPGERIKQTRVVTVTLSKGPMIISMPDLTGKTIREADVILSNNNLEIESYEYFYNDEVEEGKIFDQEPSPEDEIEVDEEIKLFVSQGVEPQTGVMPDLIGMSGEDAFSLLENSNFEVGEIERELTRRFREDQVFEQEYSPGEEIEEGIEVNLGISEGLINPHDSEVHTSTIRVEAVDYGTQEVRIEVEDDNGRDIVYQEEHQQGDFISERINSVGPTLIEVYINDELVWERETG